MAASSGLGPARAASRQGAAELTAGRQGAAEHTRPPAPEAGEGRFRRCPLPRWQRGGATGGRHAAGGAEPRADTVEPRAAPRARPEVAMGSPGPPAGRGDKAGVGVGLAALELRAGTRAGALPACLHLQGGPVAGAVPGGRGPGPHLARDGAAERRGRAGPSTGGGTSLKGWGYHSRVDPSGRGRGRAKRWGYQWGRILPEVGLSWGGAFREGATTSGGGSLRRWGQAGAGPSGRGGAITGDRSFRRWG